MKNDEKTKDYLILIIRPDWNNIEIRFRTMTEEVYNDFLDIFDDYGDEEKAIFEYDKVIKNFTWENYEIYLKKYYFKNRSYPEQYNLNDIDSSELFKLLSCFDPDNIVYFGELYDFDIDVVKKVIEIIIEELKHIKNTRKYVYEYDTYFPYYE